MDINAWRCGKHPQHARKQTQHNRTPKDALQCSTHTKDTLSTQTDRGRTQLHICKWPCTFTYVISSISCTIMHCLLNNWGHRGRWTDQDRPKTKCYFLCCSRCVDSVASGAVLIIREVSSDIHNALACRYSELQFTGCPKCAKNLTLHNTACMSADIRRATIVWINQMRSAAKGKKWEPAGDCFICNLHYVYFVGPSRKTPD